MRTNTSQHTNDIVGALNTARAEAVKRGARVAVVGGGSDWSSGGWQVIADANHDGTIDGSDTVLTQYDGLTHDYKVKTKVTGGNDAQVVFGQQGSLVTPATQADINVCRPDRDNAHSRWIHVAPSGEITSRSDTSSSPAPEC